MVNQKILFVLWASVLLAGLAAAEYPLTDPGIPSGEKCIYSTACDTITDVISEVTTVRTADGKPAYEISSKSVSADKFLTVDKASMRLLSSRTLRRGREADVEMAFTVRDKAPADGRDELRLADFSGLRYLLRGFPFGTLKVLRVNAVNGQNDFTMKVRFIGEEAMEVMGLKAQCYKLEITLSGIFSAFFPKISLWYLKDAPHYLVCSDGPSETNRKVKCLVKLIRYQAGP